MDTILSPTREGKRVPRHVGKRISAPCVRYSSWIPGPNGLLQLCNLITSSVTLVNQVIKKCRAQLYECICIAIT